MYLRNVNLKSFQLVLNTVHLSLYSIWIHKSNFDILWKVKYYHLLHWNACNISFRLTFKTRNIHDVTFNVVSTAKYICERKIEWWLHFCRLHWYKIAPDAFENDVAASLSKIWLSFPCPYLIFKHERINNKLQWKTFLQILISSLSLELRTMNEHILFSKWLFL